MGQGGAEGAGEGEKPVAVGCFWAGTGVARLRLHSTSMACDESWEFCFPQGLSEVHPPKASGQALPRISTTAQSSNLPITSARLNTARPPSQLPSLLQQ